MWEIELFAWTDGLFSYRKGKPEFFLEKFVLMGLPRGLCYSQDLGLRFECRSFRYWLFFLASA